MMPLGILEGPADVMSCQLNTNPYREGGHVSPHCDLVLMELGSYCRFLICWTNLRRATGREKAVNRTGPDVSHAHAGIVFTAPPTIVDRRIR